MNKILLFKPLYLYKIWGSNYLKRHNYTNEINIGEMWSLSGLNKNPTFCITKPYEKMGLNELFKNKDLFGDKYDEFPLLFKLLTTKSNLSIQVHPDDEYAKNHNLGLGKTEGWLILNKSFKSRLVLGLKCTNFDKIKDMVDKKTYETNLNYIEPKIGHFYPIPSKTLHAIGKNLVLIEIQQSSDNTFRFYDYDRLENGKPRPLQVKESLEVVDVNQYNQEITNIKKDKIITDNQYFKIENIKINGEYNLISKEEFYVITIVKGCIKYNDYTFKIGESFIVPINCIDKISGKGIILKTIAK